jgi:hypothetical protein
MKREILRPYSGGFLPAGESDRKKPRHFVGCAPLFCCRFFERGKESEAKQPKGSNPERRDNRPERADQELHQLQTLADCPKLKGMNS